MQAHPLRHAATLGALVLSLLAPVAAKLPPPSPEAKAKADETKAKTAHGDKVSAYKLCLSMERTAVHYHAAAKTAGKETRPPVATPPCTDPGPFVYTPPEAASVPKP